MCRSDGYFSAAATRRRPTPGSQATAPHFLRHSCGRLCDIFCAELLDEVSWGVGLEAKGWVGV